MITVEDYAVLYNGDSLDILSGLWKIVLIPLLQIWSELCIKSCRVIVWNK